MTRFVHFAQFVQIATLALLASPALAQQATCGPRSTIVTALIDDYGEARQGVGLAGGNLMMEVYASEATGTWTIIATTPQGVTCLIASGGGYAADRPKPNL